MRSFRESGIGQLIFGLIIAAIILAFVLSSGGPSIASFEEDCAVEVGKHCVEPKEFYAAYGLIASIGLNEKAAKQMGLKQLVARGLAERELLLAEAKRLGLTVSEDAIDAELLEGRTRASLPADGAERVAASLALCVDGPNGCEPGTVGLRALPFKKDGVFDFELYKRMVRVATGRSPSLFKEMQAREFTAERIRQLHQASVRVSEEEAFLTYSRVRSTAVARIAQLQNAWFERYVTSPTDAAIEKWKSEHADELKLSVDQAKTNWKPECPVVEELTIEPRGEETQEAVIARARALRARVSLEGFDKLARRESVSESAVLGGRVGCLDSSFGPGAEELLAAAAELKKPKDVSEPVVSPRGVHLVRLVDRVTAENVEVLATSFLSYKLTAAFLAQEASRKFATDLIEGLQSGKDIAELTETLTNEALAQGPLDKKDNPGLTASNKPSTDISRSFSVEQNPLPEASGSVSPSVLAFQLEKPGDVVAQPLPLRQGFGVLQLKEKDIATREKFAEERDRVIAQLQTRKAEEALSKHIQRLVDAAGGIRMNERHVPNEKDEPLSSKSPG